MSHLIRYAFPSSEFPFKLIRFKDRGLSSVSVRLQGAAGTKSRVLCATDLCRNNCGRAWSDADVPERSLSPRIRPEALSNMETYVEFKVEDVF